MSSDKKTNNNDNNNNSSSTDDDNITTEDVTGLYDLSSLRGTVAKIPLLSVRAGPRDGDNWLARLKQELSALIKYVQINKSSDSDWFLIEPADKLGHKWQGKCWFIHNLHKYEFELLFELPVSYPTTPFEIVLPELDGKTSKMYRGGKICLSSHFKPLWAKNIPHFGIAHALALGLAPWLAAEIPHLVNNGHINESDSYKHKK